MPFDKDWLKRRIKPLANFQGTAHELALAFGLGITLGIIPGTGAIAAAAVAAILRLNLPLMVAGALLTNPITTPFVYVGSFLLGSWLLQAWLPTVGFLRVVLSFLAGNLILALGLGTLGYLAVLGLTTLLRRGRLPRHSVF